VPGDDGATDVVRVDGNPSLLSDPGEIVVDILDPSVVYQHNHSTRLTAQTDHRPIPSPRLSAVASTSTHEKVSLPSDRLASF